MNFLEGLHGAVAIALLCSLLFAEEAGVPLPTPGELVLLAAGLLIAAGGLDPYVFGPLAIFACCVGAMVGYTWARAVGDRGLRSVARRLHREETLTRVTARVRTAGWPGVAVSRLIPGLRIYTTLVAGASRLRRATFLEGLVPATVVWVAVFVALGALAGVPVERFLTSLERLAVQGGLLVLVGVGVYLAARKTPAGSGAGLVRLPRWARIAFAAAIDIGVVGSIITGLLAVGRLAGIGFNASWVDAVVAALVVAAFYVVVARRSGGATVGEALLRTSYATGQRVPLGRMFRSTRGRLLLPGEELLPGAADLFRALGDPLRLALVGQLLKGAGTVTELAETTRRPAFEVEHQLERLRAARLVVATDGDRATAFQVRPDLLQPLSRLIEELPPTLSLRRAGEDGQPSPPSRPGRRSASPGPERGTDAGR
jgi:membrane protein DedA with SNARE-associated domain/DNA-binding transcriptional ArsR family regulator